MPYPGAAGVSAAVTRALGTALNSSSTVSPPPTKENAEGPRRCAEYCRSSRVIVVEAQVAAAGRESGVVDVIRRRFLAREVAARCLDEDPRDASESPADLSQRRSGPRTASPPAIA